MFSLILFMMLLATTFSFFIAVVDTTCVTAISFTVKGKGSSTSSKNGAGGSSKKKAKSDRNADDSSPSSSRSALHSMPAGHKNRALHEAIHFTYEKIAAIEKE